MICLTVQYLVQVDLWLCFIQVPMIGLQRPRHQLHPAFRSRQTTPKPLPIVNSIPCILLSHRLLRHYLPSSPWLTHHHFRLGDVGHKANLVDQTDKYVYAPLKPFWIRQTNETVIHKEDSHAMPHHKSHHVVNISTTSTVMYIQRQNKFSTTTLKSVGNVRPPCVVPGVALNWGPW